jgi:uncharacterized protein YlzI (FlbEa/FlbD family)
MATLVEFEDARGKKSFVNPDHVVAVQERDAVDYPTVITCISGLTIAVKDSVDATRKKLGM